MLMGSATSVIANIVYIKEDIKKSESWAGA